MSYEEKRDTRLGRTVIAYRHPPGFGWLLVFLGLSGVLCGGIGLALTLTQVGIATRHAQEELRSGIVLTLAFLPGGVALLVWGALELTRKPEWHICENGIVRLSKAGATRMMFWRDIEEVTVVRLMQHGRVVGSQLRIGKKTIYAPNEEVANRAYALWAEANPMRLRSAA